MTTPEEAAELRRRARAAIERRVPARVINGGADLSCHYKDAMEDVHRFLAGKKVPRGDVTASLAFVESLE